MRRVGSDAHSPLHGDWYCQSFGIRRYIVPPSNEQNGQYVIGFAWCAPPYTYWEMVNAIFIFTSRHSSVKLGFYHASWAARAKLPKFSCFTLQALRRLPRRASFPSQPCHNAIYCLRWRRDCRRRSISPPAAGETGLMMTFEARAAYWQARRPLWLLMPI